jgi:hypothetical protein
MGASDKEVTAEYIKGRKQHHLRSACTDHAAWLLVLHPFFLEEGWYGSIVLKLALLYNQPRSTLAGIASSARICTSSGLS